MQRLSIDSSSASKLHSYGGRKDDTYNIDDDSKRKESLSSPHPSSSLSPDDHDLKDVKLRRLSSLQSPYQKRENLVHVIPVLTLICFVILYLSSHDPSQSDLAQFDGFMRTSKRLESEEDGEISELMISAGDDALSIRSSIRKLRETESLPRRRTSHRKTADF
ncbi:Uncharacterized protein Rs2_17596 [Raphanus sativus]|uniref:Uncharacterized protein LOC130511825 n=1 Tax=Raphanus sativus TaxID=3726 RepID=A0A9W3DNK4_RAPSA|nr:uncharacterized protein LOC130511825 [Raphanus sativus]KAJ4903645.1 Uncharacterized protein Rs2_17596 [Raphanus sativus]